MCQGHRKEFGVRMSQERAISSFMSLIVNEGQENDLASASMEA